MMEVIEARLQDRELLNPGSSSQTFHLVIDFPNQPISYTPGDCLAIYPENAPGDIATFLDLVQLNHAETFVTFKEEKRLLKDLLIGSLDLEKVSVRLKKHLQQEYPTAEIQKQDHLFDVLTTYPLKLSSQQCIDLLSPVLPRFYSIASSPLVYPNQVHLLVKVTYKTVQNKPRPGLATDFLGFRALIGQIIRLAYVHNPKFGILQSMQSKPLIMIGPGTGIAPFKGFVEHRLAQQETQNWVFFGEREQKHDFYYQSLWEELKEKGLRFDAAFSRDQENKVYVQHLLEKHQDQVLKWMDEGGFLCLCGDASKMAKDVEASLCTMLEKHHRCSTSEALARLKNWRKEGRFLKEVY